jgi:hypothetical protein
MRTSWTSVATSVPRVETAVFRNASALRAAINPLDPAANAIGNPPAMNANAIGDPPAPAAVLAS